MENERVKNQNNNLESKKTESKIKEGVDFVFEENPEISNSVKYLFGLDYKNYKGDANPVMIDYFGQGISSEIDSHLKNKGISIPDKAKIEQLVNSFIKIGNGNFLDIKKWSDLLDLIFIL